MKLGRFLKVGGLVGAMILGMEYGAAAETVTWWVPNWDEPAARTLVADYTKAHPDDQVDIVITTWDTMAQKILAALSGSNPPDVISELESRTVLYASRGMLTDLTSWFDRDLKRSDFFDSALETGTYKDHLYSLPFRHDGSGMIYNKDMFTAAGLDPDKAPVTWDDFISDAQKLTIKQGDNTTQYGTAWPFGNVDNATARYLMLLFDRGGTLFNADRTQVQLDTPQAIDAMQALTDTVKNGLAPHSSLEIDNNGVRDLFVNKRIAMFVTGAYDVQPLRDAGLNIGTAELPGVKGVGLTTTDGFSLIIPKKAPHAEAAWRFATFIAQPDSQTRLTASFPANTVAAKDPKFNTPDMKPFLDQLSHGFPQPNHPKWAALEQTLFNHMQSIVLGEETVEDGMKAANDEINSQLQS